MSAVLVTRGAGFLGTAIVRRLAARGDRVVALDSAQAGVPRSLEGVGPGVTLVSGDVTDRDARSALVRAHRLRRIVHAAAIVGVTVSLEVPREVLRVNIEGTLSVLEAMRAGGVERAVHISSEETYDPFRYEPADEEHSLAPAHPYGITKVASEHLGRFYRSAHGLGVVSVRTSQVYGPWLPRPRIPRTLIEPALEGRPLHLLQGGDARVDHTYLDDCVDGVLLALDHPEHPHDADNIASDEGRTTAEMVAIIGALVPGAQLSVGPGPHRDDERLEAPRKGALDLTRARRPRLPAEVRPARRARRVRRVVPPRPAAGASEAWR